MYSVAPFGERRQDIRAAINTLTAMLAHSTPENKPSEQDLQEMLTALQNYLPCYKSTELEFDPDALARIQK